MTASDIFDIQTTQEFEQTALDIFEYQYEHCRVYRQYTDMLGKSPCNVKTVNEIPFLPIEFFKKQEIIAEGKTAELIFTSSGTTGAQTSTHFVADASIYRQSLRQCFEYFIGKPEEFAILGLLPSYLERENSSLVYMVAQLIARSGHGASNFYLNNTDELMTILHDLHRESQPMILFGVSFALLDLLEKYSLPSMPNLSIIETGGMKGRRKEISREKLYKQLFDGFVGAKLYSEYGMTELLSQAYSLDGRTFQTPPWMRIFLRDLYDPFTLLTESHQQGGINAIDLANIYSCSFIATQDVGKFHSNGCFEVLGRFADADLRGCNMLVDGD